MAKHLFDVKKGKKESVTDFITNSFNDHKERMRAIHRSWALNLAWVKGHQNVDFNPKTVSYNQVPRRSWQSRLVSNLMLPVQKAAVSRLISNSPTWDILPATPDEKDIQISRISKMILDHIWQQHKLTQKLIRTLTWQSTCCSAFMKVGWDSDAGQDIQVASNDVNEEYLTQFIEMLGVYEMPKMLDVKEGDLFFDPIPPFNMAFDPLASVIDDSDWCIETQVRSLDWIVDKFGNKWKDKISESDSIDILLHPYVFDENSPKPKNGVMTHELFVRKTKRFPKGLYCLTAGEEVLVTPRDNPYEHGMLPYAHFMETYDSAGFYGTCAVEQIRPNQARYNKIQSVITDCINLMGKPKWTISRQAGVRSINNKPGEIIWYNGILKPEQIQPKPLPAYIQQTLEQVRRDMQDTASFHNVSSGQNEPGVRSGRAVLALQGADDEQQGPSLIWYDTAMTQLGILSLQLLNQYVTEERIIQIAGEFNQLETQTYSGEMLQGNNKGNYYDVRVNTYTTNFMSRAAREDLLRALTELGYMNPERDRTLALNMIGLGNTTSLFDELAADRARQWKEIQIMTQGQKVPAARGENHEVHLQQLKKFMASGRRDELEPEVIELIQAHLIDHQRLQVVEAMTQQMMAMEIADNARGRNETTREGGNGRGTNQSTSSGGRGQTGVTTENRRSA